MGPFGGSCYELCEIGGLPMISKNRVFNPIGLILLIPTTFMLTSFSFEDLKPDFSLIEGKMVFLPKIWTPISMSPKCAKYILFGN